MNILSGSFKKISEIEFRGEACSFFRNEGFNAWFAGRAYFRDKDSYTGIQNPAELLVMKFEKEGIKAFLDIDGDFTTILLSNSDSKIYIFRDFKGAGPQFFYTDSEFSSSLFSLVSGGENTADHESLSFFLRYGIVPPGKTGIEGVRQLEPGGLLVYENNEIRVDQLIDEFIKLRIDLPSGNEEKIKAYRKLHQKSILDRVKNQKEISLLLSGGYDSGANLSALREVYEGPVSAYTVSFKDNPHSELEFVKIMASHFNATLHNYELKGDEIFSLPSILKHTGVPFQESGLMINYSVMREVGADKPSIVLGGDGNDQLFGTGGQESAMKVVLTFTGIIYLLRIFRRLTIKKETALFKKVNFYIDKVDNVMKADRWGFEKSDLKYKKAEKKLFRWKFWLTAGNVLRKRREKVDIPLTIAAVILFKASRMAELFQVNLSFPYLSVPLLSYINSLGRKWRFRGNIIELIRGKGKSKFMHKSAYRDHLPEQITARKKQGGFVPLSVFFKNPVRNEDFLKFISESALIDELLVDKKRILDDMKAFLMKKDPWFWEQQFRYSQFLNLLVLAVWEKIYLENKELNKPWKEE